MSRIKITRSMVTQIDIADGRFLVPPIHGINCLLQLCAAALVDANSVYTADTWKRLKPPTEPVIFHPQFNFHFVFFIPLIILNHLFHDFRGIHIIPVSTQGPENGTLLFPA
jgi:hypothetical protein